MFIDSRKLPRDEVIQTEVCIVGVVDSNCKVHGVSNLFIAGSSVFPTGGYANPTLTFVALAIRLADHLKMFIEL